MKNMITNLMKRGYLLDPSFLDFINKGEQKIDLDSFLIFLEKQKKENFILDFNTIKDYYNFLKNIKNKSSVNTDNTIRNDDFSDVSILETYEEKNLKISVQDFVNLYNERFKLLQNVLKQRKELESSVSIKRIFMLDDKENVSFIGMISDISYTKNNNLILTLEDQTGKIKAILTKNKELDIDIKELTNDEVVGITGVKSQDIVFINSILFPDIPINGGLKKSNEDISAVFISDIHVGSKAFLKKEFENFISWLNLNYGDEKYIELAKKVKYLFIIGDLVEGIGIYPNQEKDLEIPDIFKQYAVFSEYIKKIPNNIRVIISPGNHDTLRISEPQPFIPKEFVLDLYERKNVFFVSNPSVVKIAQKNDFSGFDVLIYHGFSFPYYADAIEPLRLNGGLENTESIMQYLLKKRHLAPTHGSTQYQLGYEKDPLFIKNIPDFFVSGHVHRANVKNYRSVTMMNCGCWISQTDYQEKRGIIPMPAKAIYVNLSSRETKILDFNS